jgi:hypothetical protein
MPRRVACVRGRQWYYPSMPAKKTTLTDEERAKRIRETAREVEATGTAEDFEQAFKKVVPPKPLAPPKS